MPLYPHVADAFASPFSEWIWDSFLASGTNRIWCKWYLRPLQLLTWFLGMLVLGGASCLVGSIAIMSSPYCEQAQPKRGHEERPFTSSVKTSDDSSLIWHLATTASKTPVENGLAMCRTLSTYTTVSERKSFCSMLSFLNIYFGCTGSSLLCTQAFCSCGKRGLLSTSGMWAYCGFSASLIVEHGL